MSICKCTVWFDCQSTSHNELESKARLFAMLFHLNLDVWGYLSEVVMDDSAEGLCKDFKILPPVVENNGFSITIYLNCLNVSDKEIEDRLVEDIGFNVFYGSHCSISRFELDWSTEEEMKKAEDYSETFGWD